MPEKIGFWIATIANVVSAIIAYLDRRRRREMESQGNPPPKSSYLVMGILLLLSWGAIAFDYYDRHFSGLGPIDPIQSIKQDTNIVREWGLADHEKGGPHRLQLLADGRRILSYNPKFQSDYRLALICFRTDGTKDYLDIEPLQKSALYDIPNTHLHIILSLDEAFVEEWIRGASMTNYFLFLVPRGVEMNQFTTIRQAQALDAIQLAGRAGPP